MNPISSFKQASVPKKAAVIAGAAVAAAGVASFVYAAKTGSGDKFIKKVGDGYVNLGSKIAEGASNAWNFVKEKFGDIASKFAKKAPEVAEEAAEVAGAAGEALEGAAGAVIS